MKTRPATRPTTTYVSPLAVDHLRLSTLPASVAVCPACVAAGILESWLLLAEDKQGRVFFICSQITRPCAYISAVPQNDSQAVGLFISRCPRCQGPMRLCLTSQTAIPFLVCCQRPRYAGVVGFKSGRRAK